MIKIFIRFIKEWIYLTKYLVKDLVLWLQQLLDTKDDNELTEKWKVK